MAVETFLIAQRIAGACDRERSRVHSEVERHCARLVSATTDCLFLLEVKSVRLRPFANTDGRNIVAAQSAPRLADLLRVTDAHGATRFEGIRKRREIYDRYVVRVVCRDGLR